MTQAEKAARHFKKHLNPSEKLLWAGISKITPYTPILILAFCIALCGLGYIIYLRYMLETKSLSNFFYILPRCIPSIIGLAIAIFFLRKEDQAYGITAQRVLIKKGNGELVAIDLQQIVSVKMDRIFWGSTFRITALVANNEEETVVHALFNIVHAAVIEQQLRPFIKK